jgi:hypothetical protein
MRGVLYTGVREVSFETRLRSNWLSYCRPVWMLTSVVSTVTIAEREDATDEPFVL